MEVQLTEIEFHIYIRWKIWKYLIAQPEDGDISANMQEIVFYVISSRMTKRTSRQSPKNVVL